MTDEAVAELQQPGSRAHDAPDNRPRGVSWQDGAVVQNYLTGVRGAIPGAAEQLAMMVRLVAALERPIHRVLDLGAGDGVLTATLLGAFPGAEATIVDFSPPMLAAARARFANTQPPVRIFERDLGQTGWTHGLVASAPFDVIVSGYAIHHLPDGRKQVLYEEVFDLLAPGGVFINMDHVASSSVRLAGMFDQAMVDALTQFRRQETPDLSREAVEAAYANRPDRLDNILASVDVQCDWLREIGFQEVDCFFKWFELALFGGFKLAEAPGEETWPKRMDDAAGSASGSAEG
jgi:SAM-dependent methyltransferase